MNELMSRRWGPFRQEWYSLCSMHFYYDERCHMCQAGRWVNVYKHMFVHTIFLLFPDICVWWNNRPNSKARQFLKKHFPNLH